MSLEENKKTYIDLLRTVQRDGVDSLITYLEGSDFFTAPASCNYHQNWVGGLCEHSLRVYNNLVKIVEDFGLKEYDKDSLILVSLLHDLAKVNFYEQYDKNVKVNGQWVQEKHYKVRGLGDRFIYGTHEQTSLFIAQQFVPLTIEEQVSINCHHGGMSADGFPLKLIGEVYCKYKLPLYLHIADLLDAFNEPTN